MTKVNGELISIDDSAYDGFKGMTVYGNTVQNLWVNQSGTQNGVTVTSNADGSATVNGTSTGLANTYKQVYTLRPGSKYTVSVDKVVQSSNDPSNGCFFLEMHDSDSLLLTRYVGYGTVTAVTFTVPANATFARIGFYCAKGRTVSGTYRVMLNEGSTAQPWCPPGLNGVDELSIVTAGKNLFTPNSNTQIQGNGKPNQVLGIGAKASGIPMQQKVVVSLEYRLSSGAGTMLLQQYGAPYIVLGINPLALVGDGQWHKVSGSVTVNDSFNKTDDVSIRFDNVTGLFEFRNIQFELGSTATAYEPPNVTTTPVDLDGHSLCSLPDGTRDELHIDGTGAVTLVQRVGVATYDGSEDEAWGYQAYKIGMNNGAPGLETVFNNANGRCNTLPIIRSLPSPSILAYVGGWVDIRIDDVITDVESGKAWLAANHTTLLYPLAAPQTIDLGKISLPKLRKKPLVNNVWANGTAEGTGFSLAPEIDCEYNQWSTYCDGFKTHGKHSYFDMGCCIAARDTGTPEKKSVTATVPYMSGFYDLSKLYGAIAFEARELMYRFEFVEDSREELQQRKSQFLEWLSQVHDEEIADDDIPGRHFVGSLSEWEFEEGEEGQSGSLEVTFNCQPFLEADGDTTKTCSAGSNTVTVNGQAVNAYAKTSSGTATIRIGGVTQSVGTTEIRLSVQLQPGANAVTVTGSPVTLRWKELTV